MRQPGVVWFGETLPEAVLTAAWRAEEHCGLFLSLGTSSLVEPAASLCWVAATAGARTVEINPQETPLSSWVDVSMRGTTGRLLPMVQ